MAVGENRRHWIKTLNSDSEYWRDEITVDNFAGGGGASTGYEMATGRSVEVAINHEPAAVAMHTVNHPLTRHYCEDVWEVDPRTVYPDKRIGLLWLSPDCTHHSKARGGKPREKKIRGLAWIALRWAAIRKPRVIMLENVEEFRTWGPLDKEGQPIKSQSGRTFRTFVNALRRQGYEVEWRELRACDYGAPTIRKRFFLIARSDGRQIVWPEPTHGAPDATEVMAGKRLPWRTAAECIDWSIPVSSIFGRKKELADNTKRRIARGVMKFVVNNPEPFIIRFTQSGFGGDGMQYRIDQPLTTIMTKAEHALVVPTLVKHDGGNDNGPGNLITDPLSTITTTDHNALVTAFLTQYHTETTGNGIRGQSLGQPLLTQDTSNRYGLVAANLVKFRGQNTGQCIDTPLHTITAGGNHHGLVYAFLTAYYGSSVGQDLHNPLGTVTTHERFGLVLVKVDGVLYEIVDIGMRMLEPHELYTAQGFPKNYIINGYNVNGRPVTKAAQVARCGNSVPPQFTNVLVRANLPEHCIGSRNRLTFERYTEQIGQLQLSM
ncbi:DNA cytosine methyltransferase [Paenibacillus sinopodophylli]|uniref:DNA cytosine methyltransferase n=1 Tax=Paenibacillus sinopodophylli TaxID=1837342 RepID=UPI00110CA3DC|nr:DNA cytosine methyltransferase [Paenibacillus sinopodophylli]